MANSTLSLQGSQGSRRYNAFDQLMSGSGNRSLPQLPNPQERVSAFVVDVLLQREAFFQRSAAQKFALDEGEWGITNMPSPLPMTKEEIEWLKNILSNRRAINNRRSREIVAMLSSDQPSLLISSEREPIGCCERVVAVFWRALNLLSKTWAGKQD